MQLPLANATLVAVRAAGVSEDFDTPAGEGAEKWSDPAGVGVFLTEKSELVAMSDRADIVVTRSVLAPADVPVDFQTGDVLVLERGVDTITESVQAVQRTEYPGVPGVVRLHLLNA